MLLFRNSDTEKKSCQVKYVDIYLYNLYIIHTTPHPIEIAIKAIEHNIWKHINTECKDTHM